MKTELINVAEDGSIEWIGDKCPLDLPLGKIRRRRVSTIRPAHNGKRMVFQILRTVFGEQGRVAAFTRRWNGPWIATILSTGETAVFENRQAAIDWELEILRGPNFEW